MTCEDMDALIVIVYTWSDESYPFWVTVQEVQDGRAFPLGQYPDHLSETWKAGFVKCPSVPPSLYPQLSNLSYDPQ